MATVLDDIIQALTNLGGQATLKDIYSEVERIKTSPLTRTWPAKVRQTIEFHSSDSKVFKGKDYFHRVGRGVWALRNRSGIISFQPAKTKDLDQDYKDHSPHESFETISNILKTIKEYRGYSEPASASWVDYIQEFFHILGFSTEKHGSRLIFLKNLDGVDAPKAIVAYALPGENYDEIIPGLSWETYLLFAANYYRIEWGVLTNGLHLNVFNYGASKDRSPFIWPDLDGIIENERLENFFQIFQVFSYINQGSVVSKKSHHLVASDSKSQKRLKSETKNTQFEQTKRFVHTILEQRFSGDFRRVGRYIFMFESNSELVYFQNANVESDVLWYRVDEKERQLLESSSKQAYLCLTNPPRTLAFIFPIEMIEEQVKLTGWDRGEFEIHLNIPQLRWVQFDWDISQYLYQT